MPSRVQRRVFFQGPLVTGPSPGNDGLLAVRVASSSEDHGTVELRGEIDGYSAPRLRRCLRKLTDAGHRRIVLDFTGIEFIDSAGLGVLIGATRCLKERRGELVVASPRPQAAKLLEMTRLDTVVTVQREA